LDGSLFGNFKPTRGIRQGDPLSHFLFILGSKILSRLILRDEALGSLQGIKVAPLSPPISHLLFADDVMIFTRSKVQDANAVLNCLSTYFKWFGQRINLSKLVVFFTKNCSVNAISEVNGILNLPLIPVRAKYLGIPLFLSHNKRDAFMDIKDRICSKIISWKAKLLSQATRTTLLKSVANAIPTYLMSLFLIPKSVCSEITAIMRKFWWGFPQDKKHSLAFLSWDTICQPKALGGLRIRPLKFLNHSLLARLGWKLIINDTAPWVVVLKSKYLKDNVSFLETSSSSTSSWFWKGLLNNREVVKKWACISISNGAHVDVWSSPWILLLPDFRPRPNVNLPDIPEFCVADLIIPSGRVWNKLLLQDIFDPFMVECILSIHLPFSRNFDKWFWASASSGIFTVKSTFTVACSTLGRSLISYWSLAQALGLKDSSKVKASIMEDSLEYASFPG
jgi:hypothetical protein